MRTPINPPLLGYRKYYILLILLIFMDSFSTWVLRGLNAKQSKSRLLQISDLIDWVPIRHKLDEMYDNKSEKGGRPNCDVVLMFKILILQHWYGLSDLEIERQMADRISFMAFLGFPDPFPDSRTIWLFKDRMAKTETDKVVWAELQRQLDAKGLQVKRGTIQDATFIEADPGSSKKPRGVDAKTRRSRDGTWAKKGDELHFGYKLHQKTDIDHCLIREIETTTASLHDSQVDLSAEGEVVLRDRGYFGVTAKGIDYTMKRRTTEKALEELDKERNRLISILRSPGERPHAVIKRIFGAGRVLVTTVRRVAVKMMVTAFAFNLYQLCTLKNARVI
jgi:transposase, IS5 family